MLCKLILSMSDGTFSLKSTLNDRFWESFHAMFLFIVWPGICTADSLIRSQHATYYTTATISYVRAKTYGQAAIRHWISTRQTPVLSYRRYVNEIEERYSIHIIWVPGHSNFSGNYRAYELSKRGIIIAFTINSLAMPLKICKFITNNGRLRTRVARYRTSD